MMKLASDGGKWENKFSSKNDNMMEKHSQIKVFDEQLMERGSVEDRFGRSTLG